MVKEEERRAFLEYSYFKLKEEYFKDISKFNNDEEIEIERADIIGIISNKELEFVKHPYEI